MRRGIPVSFRLGLDTGGLKDQISADIPRPERLPPHTLAVKHKIRTGAMLWRTKYGQFDQQSDGPGGWIEPLKLLQGRIALPRFSGAVVIDVAENATEALGFVPFEGKLRARRIVDGQSLLVNEKGQHFRAPL